MSDRASADGDAPPQCAPDGGAPTLRALVAADIEAMLDLWRRAGLPHRPSGRDAPGAIAAQLETEGELFLGAFAGERLVATALGTLDGRQKGWIQRLAVDPAWRRRGLAARLVAALEKRLEARGCLILAALIEADNASSLALFEQRLGFERTEIVYLRRPRRSDA
ncbi:MAG: GNAT family N-acetyltransferase [Candidatus Eiseniibacteriota bacterium]